MTTTEVGIDPHRFVSAGDRTYDVSGWDNRETGIYVDNTCGEEGRSGWYCSRAHHPESWQHIAASGGTIARAWGGDDPFKGVEVGQDVSLLERWQHPDKGLRVVEERWCRAGTQTDGRFCTRVMGHSIEWAHVSVAANGQVIGLLAPISLDAPYVELVPEDGSDPDPEDSVLTAPPIHGQVVKLRDRSQNLFVIGYRSENDTVETLNLTAPDAAADGSSVPLYRVIPLDHLVRSEATLRVEDMPRIQSWFNDHRERVRKVGIREMRKGTWCRPGMEEAFREMAVDPFEPELRGDIHMHLRFTCADISTTRSTVQEKLLALFGTDEFRTLFARKGLDMDWMASSASADNFHRG